VRSVRYRSVQPLPLHDARATILYPRRISGEKWRREEIKKGREGEEWNGENRTPPNLNKTVDQLQNSTKLYSILLFYMNIQNVFVQRSLALRAGPAY